jgi:hypothetical protein
MTPGATQDCGPGDLMSRFSRAGCAATRTNEVTLGEARQPPDMLRRSLSLCPEWMRLVRSASRRTIPTGTTVPMGTMVLRCKTLHAGQSSRIGGATFIRRPLCLDREGGDISKELAE